MDWRSAFIAQAKSDFQTAEHLSRQGGMIARCHLLHYLQMALEKLSKGMLAQPGSMVPPPQTHLGATQLLQVMKNGGPLTADFHRVLDMSNAQRKAYLQGLLPGVLAMERLAPALAQGGANAEYPWMNPANDCQAESVICPSAHSFPELSESKVIKIMELIRALLKSCS